MFRPIRSLIIIFVILGLLVPLFFALAHEPRFMPSTPATILVKDPDISQAFYANLNGSPDSYSITTDKPLHLYVAILVPDLSISKKDIFVIATDTHAQSVIFTLNGTGASWKRFYEPFGGDWYLQGPETELDIPAGAYHITVSNADNMGKYVLAVGKTESFSFREIINALITIPRIKLFYFDKSIPETLVSPWGIIFIIFLVLIGSLTSLGVYLFRRYSLKKHFISFYSMLYYRYIRKVGKITDNQ